MTAFLETLPEKRIGIVGLGLMGGSLARSLRNLANPPFVRAFSLDREELRMAVEAGVIDEGGEEGADRDPGLGDLDLVVYCTPLAATLALLPAHKDRFGTATLITDLVSLKGPVMEAARGAGLGDRFVGSHPMCGGEGSGFGASRDGLFTGAKVWVVAGEATLPAVEAVSGFWRSLGGTVAPILAGDHDRLMAVASHLPQLTATALGAVVAGAGLNRDDLGPGGKDMTRLAGSGPEMWLDLLRYAPEDLSKALDSVARTLRELKERLESGREGEIGELMDRTRVWFKEGKWS